MEQRIVCAANRDANGDIYLGLRHHDRFMEAPHASEQGFVDNRGRFLTRQEAWAVALANGQVLRRVGGDDAAGGTLYSENLY